MRFIIPIFLSLLALTACTETSDKPGPFGTAVERQTQHSQKQVTFHITHPWDQWGEKIPSWVTPTEPFQIIENVYYVGSEGLSSFLITSDAGHVLIDGTLPQNVPQIVDNIESLGFSIQDVKILLNSHAHFDHSGGLKELKTVSGAKLMSSEGDRSALEGGFYLGDEYDEASSVPKVKVDETVADGEVIKLGHIELTANITPGHSRGCTSWTMPVIHAGETFETVFFCSATVAGNRLIPEQYAGIIADYQHTFDKTRNWRPDVFLSNHPSFFKMKDKREKQKSGDALAFVDRAGFPNLMTRLEADFKEKLAEAKSEQEALQDRLSAFAFDPTKIDPSDHYIFYSHGRIIEDQGVPAHSPRFGPYEYVEILERLRSEGFTVFSKARGADADAAQNAGALVTQVEMLLEEGVPDTNITMVGASKGAYITSLAAHELENPDINIVLLAGCSHSVVLQMIEADMALYGNVLTIRDGMDLDLSGSCAPIIKMSSGVSDYKEILTQNNLGHGLIYTAHEDWVAPTLAWAKGK